MFRYESRPWEDSSVSDNGKNLSFLHVLDRVNIKHTANEGPVRIQYKCLVPIYVFPEMKLCRPVISKTEL